MPKNRSGKECTEAYCKRWSYQCESDCWKSQPWNKEKAAEDDRKDEEFTDKIQIYRLKQRGYTIRKTIIKKYLGEIQ